MLDQVTPPRRASLRGHRSQLRLRRTRPDLNRDPEFDGLLKFCRSRGRSARMARNPPAAAAADRSSKQKAASTRPPDEARGPWWERRGVVCAAPPVTSLSARRPPEGEGVPDHLAGAAHEGEARRGHAGLPAEHALAGDPGVHRGETEDVGGEPEGSARAAALRTTCRSAPCSPGSARRPRARPSRARRRRRRPCARWRRGGRGRTGRRGRCRPRRRGPPRGGSRCP